uniref:Uncharacterized protein n=1 Tax=Johnson-sea-linkia profunda TaxID=575876 RepID=A0A386AXM6_9CHLO|nr:hypothetical protein [Johnson-sea-linkia profunda]
MNRRIFMKAYKLVQRHHPLKLGFSSSQQVSQSPNNDFKTVSKSQNSHYFRFPTAPVSQTAWDVETVYQTAWDVETVSQSPNFSGWYQPQTSKHPIEWGEWELELRMDKYVDQQNQDWLELQLHKQQNIQHQRNIVLPQQQIQEQIDEFQDMWETEFQEQMKSFYLEEQKQDCLDLIEVRGHFLSDQSCRFQHIQLGQQTDEKNAFEMKLLEADLIQTIETQNSHELTQLTHQMVESQYRLNKTAFLEACDLEVHNETIWSTFLRSSQTF